jgi:hypothetical protein
MSRTALLLARFCSAAWMGAATLFVIVGVLEVTRTGFDSNTKDILVSIRFPAFYQMGLTLLFVAWAGACVADFHPELAPRRRAFAILSLLFALALMFVDYRWVYGPLLSMVSPPGQSKPAAFATYHQLSKYINFAGLACTLIATISLNLPRANQDGDE